MQSIADIVTTPRLSRVLRRAYGSDLMSLIDAPMTDRTVLAAYATIATALEAWEPRFRLTAVAIDNAEADGRLQLALRGVYLPNGHKGDPTPDGEEARSLAFKMIDKQLRQVV